MPTAVDLCGRTTVAELTAVIAAARVVLCNDAGIALLAAANCTPSVVVVTPGDDYERWVPGDSDQHYPVLVDGAEATPEAVEIVLTALASTRSTSLLAVTRCRG